MNEKGFSYVDSVLAVGLIGLLFVTTMGFFNNYLSQSKKIDEHYTYYTIVTNHIDTLYQKTETEIDALATQTLSSDPSITCSYTVTTTTYETKRVETVCVMGSYQKTLTFEKKY